MLMNCMNKRIILTFTILLCYTFFAFTLPVQADDEEGMTYRAFKASRAPVVDGLGNDECWNGQAWADINYLWLGQKPLPEDYTGRYKIAWTPERLYFLIEITDDVLSDTHKDPLVDYYKDDTLEIFIDENHSGGDHAYNNNAFAYHIAMDYNSVDLGKNGPVLLNNHLKIKRTNSGDKYTWEVELKVYPDTYAEGSGTNAPVTLLENKELGFAIAYCDNDGGADRDSFIGSVDIPGDDKNLAWQNATVFAVLKLLPGAGANSKEIIQRYSLGSKSYYINEVKKEMDMAPIVKDGRTFLPVRYVMEAVGADVKWDEKDKKVEILLGDKNVQLWVGKNYAIVNGERKQIDTANNKLTPFVVNGRTILPLRFVSESLGLDVGWNARRKEATITCKVV